MPKNRQRVSPEKPKLNRRPGGLLLILLVWSLAMGWLLALASNVQGQIPSGQIPLEQIAPLTNSIISQASPEISAKIGTVDVVPQGLKMGQELYLENCASCHIGIPPAVFPTQTWRDLIQDSQHYGAQIKPLVDPQRILVWRYLSAFSRPVNEGESTPYRFANSRFFKALHPDVKFSQPNQVGTCIQCHPSAKAYNFRQLTPEWQ